MLFRVRVCWYNPSGSASDSSELTIGSFLLLLLGAVLRPAMFAVTSKYSISEKVLLVRERRLLVDRETDADDNRLSTDCLLACELHWHSKSIAMMSRSQQHDGVI